MDQINPDDLILVAVMKHPRDLHIARVLGWYRIPVRTAPKILDVGWLAFYLTAAFAEERWSVRYLAPVLGHELALRRELLRDEADHPRAEEPYIKMRLGTLVALDEAIPAGGWRRFTFLYTTGERLRRARKLKDLRVPSSAARDRLWRLLRERAEHVFSSVEPDDPQ